jgi:hypothetical protein
MDSEHGEGWISFGSHSDISRLTDGQRQIVEEHIRERRSAQGELLGVVEVRVYQFGCQSQVNFPDGSILGVETDAPVISELVARAAADLLNWR